MKKSQLIDTKMIKVAILTNIPSPYHLPLFNAISYFLLSRYNCPFTGVRAIFFVNDLDNILSCKFFLRGNLFIISVNFDR